MPWCEILVIYTEYMVEITRTTRYCQPENRWTATIARSIQKYIHHLISDARSGQIVKTADFVILVSRTSLHMSIYIHIIFIY